MRSQGSLKTSRSREVDPNPRGVPRKQTQIVRHLSKHETRRKRQNLAGGQEPEKTLGQTGMRTGKILLLHFHSQKLSVLATSHGARAGTMWVKDMGSACPIPNCYKRPPCHHAQQQSLSLSLSLPPSLSHSPKALCLIAIHISLMVPICTQVLLFFHWEHDTSQVVVTLMPQLYVKVRGKFYFKKDK